MKYKVGDKLRVRSDYWWMLYNDELKKTVTITSVHNGYYEVDDDNYEWTDEMFDGLADEELTAEEAIRIQAEMCSSVMCKDCAIDKLRYDSHYECSEFRSKNPDKVVEVLKQWKADHEKKPIETEFIWYLLVVEEKTHIVKYEKPLKIERERTTDEQKEELLREWCSEHDGKYYVTTERRCVVKE